MIKKIAFSILLTFSIFLSAQDSPQSIAVYWDASFSMVQKDLEKEIFFITEYISSNDIQIVDIKTFANTVIDEKTFTIENDETDELISYLKTVTYDGATRHPLLPQSKNNNKKILYFSDEIPPSPSTNRDLLLVDSSPTPTATNGNNAMPWPYIPLSLINQVTLASLIQEGFPAEKMQAYKVENNVSKSKTITVSGYVYDDNGVVKEARVTSLGNLNNSTMSNDEGFYTMSTYPKDIISVKTVRGKEQLIKVESDQNIEIQLNFGEKMNSLNEIVITGKTKKIDLPQSEYWEEDRSKGYSIVRVTSDQYLAGQTDLGQFISGKVPGIKYQGKQDVGSAIIRGFSSIQGTNHPLVFIDGIPTEQSQKLNKTDYSYIDPSNIKDVKVLKGLAATAIYGPNAVNGVILITTLDPSSSNKQEVKKGRRGTTKRMKDKLEVINPNKFNPLIKKLNESQNRYSSFLKERLTADDNVDFYFDAYDALKLNGDKEIALRVLSNITEIYKSDRDASIALALKLGQEKHTLLSGSLLEELSQAYPNSLIIKRNLALNHINQRKFKSAGNLYKEILDVFPLSPDYKQAIETEILNLYTKFPKEISSWNLPNIKLKKLALDGLITVEWNVPNDNFSFQFVNPTKNFYQWKHDDLRDQSTINQEFKVNNQLQEFQLINAEKGDWFFNILIPENRQPIPNSFVKMTIISNLGRPSEKTEVRMLNLNENVSSATLGKIKIR